MANDDKSGTNLASSSVTVAALATGAYFFRREAPLEMIANIEEVGFCRREAVDFVTGGVWLILADLLAHDQVQNQERSCNCSNQGT
jgi:hypothetical protein